MEKKCLVIMPTAEPEGYAQGHFQRVYDYIIVPACRLAGFSPARADDAIALNNIAMETIRGIVESDMVICDLSSRDPHSLRGLAIRQALGLPVILIKDIKTANIYEVTEFGPVEYDESLRIDTVQKEVEVLTETLNTSFANKGEINALLNRLNLGPGQIPGIQALSYSNGSNTDEPEAQEEKPEPKEEPLPIISPLPDYVGDSLTELDIEKLKAGDFIFHMNHGKGEIGKIKKMGKDKIADIQFVSGPKILVLGTSGFFRKINE